MGVVAVVEQEHQEDEEDQEPEMTPKADSKNESVTIDSKPR